MSKLATFFAGATIFALTGVAAAGTVQYTVSGLGPTNYTGPHAAPDGAPHLVDGLGYPGDAVGYTGYTGTLDLTPGSYVQKINTLTWSISYTYAGTDNDWTNDSWPDGSPNDWLQLQFAVGGARTMSFSGGSTGSVNQTGLLEVNWDNDYLGLSAGTASTFYVPGYRIDVTPLGVDRTGGSNFDGFPGGTPWIQPNMDIMAQFDVTAGSFGVPEPASLSVLAIGAAGLLLRRRKD